MALALPNSREWTTSEPTPYEVSPCNMSHTYTKYIAPNRVQLSLCMHKCGCEKSHPRTSTVAFFARIWICEIRVAKDKRQVNAFILYRDTFIPLTFSPILAQESRLKRLQMPRHGVSECGIGCKGNEKNDYSRIFSWLFFVVWIKTEVWAHKEDLLRPISFLSPWWRLPHDKPYHHF